MMHDDVRDLRDGSAAAAQPRTGNRHGASAAGRFHADAVIIGCGLAGVVTALELLDRNISVILVERGDSADLGGLALQSFGGMMLVDTPLQRRMRIPDSPALALADWHSFAEFGEGDDWPRRWAEHYVERCTPDVFEWLQRFRVGFFPAVMWAERGWHQPGNSVPRYHVIWGTGEHLTRSLIGALQSHPKRRRLKILARHTVRELMRHESAINGCAGMHVDTGKPFTVEAPQVVIASGGITGNLDKVREHWPTEWGHAPTVLLNGSHLAADGAMHDAVAALGGRITHLDKMWNYAAGVHHPRPRFPGHGLSLIPCKSALWLDHEGRRIGPDPLVTGFDTRYLVQRIAQLPRQYSWQVLNRRIAVKELAASGAEHNHNLRDRRLLGFMLDMLRGNRALLDELVAQCPDIIVADSLQKLAEKMNRLTASDDVQASVLEREIRRYDDQIARGPRYHDDDQLRRIAHLRSWPGDRIRTCRFQRIVDPAAGPLIAIREFILTRKTLGGMQTDLASRVLDQSEQPIPGLYAVGEASGFGGGGSSGKRSLEGTCLTGCILTAQGAARAIAAGGAATADAAPHRFSELRRVQS